MRDYWNYAKEKRKQLAILAVLLLLLEISGVLLLPHVMEQWSHDRKIGILHLILGLTIGLAGAVGILWMLKNICIRRRMDWKRELLKWSFWYFLIQIAIGMIQGGIGVLLYQTGLVTYEMAKQILYVICIRKRCGENGFWQFC